MNLKEIHCKNPTDKMMNFAGCFATKIIKITKKKRVLKTMTKCV